MLDTAFTFWKTFALVTEKTALFSSYVVINSAAGLGYKEGAAKFDETIIIFN